jgi:hypothetical protein
MNYTLEAARSRNLLLISAQADTDTIMGNTTTKSGKVWYQVKPDVSVRLRILFDKKQVGSKPAHEERREYLLDNGWLIDRDYLGKIETNRQVSQPGEKVNLFQLGKGPLPLPIGQDKKDVHDQFDVTLVPPAQGDPPGTVHLQLKPKPAPILRENSIFWIFGSIGSWLCRFASTRSMRISRRISRSICRI